MKLFWVHDDLLLEFTDTERGTVYRKISAEDVPELYAEIRKHYKLNLLNDDTLIKENKNEM